MAGGFDLNGLCSARADRAASDHSHSLINEIENGSVFSCLAHTQVPDTMKNAMFKKTRMEVAKLV